MRPTKRGMYEPTSGPVIVQPFAAHCTERVRLRWTLRDGTTFDQYLLCPTPETIAAARKKEAEDAAIRVPLERCAANIDGDCCHSQCPQIRDNEPETTGRHCPLDRRTYEE